MRVIMSSKYTSCGVASSMAHMLSTWECLPETQKFLGDEIILLICHLQLKKNKEQTTPGSEF